MTTSFTTIIVTAQEAGQRLDRLCTDKFSDLSRERVKQLIDNGGIHVAGLPPSSTLKPSTKVEDGWQIHCTIPEAEEYEPQPENIPLDILYEDSDVIVINKTAGMVVHPAAGNWTGTLVNALLHHCGDSLSGIGGVKRPGIVHRLDKDTSGVMIVAKNDHAHAHLSAQLSARSLSRIYLALVWDMPIPPYGTISIPIGRDHKNRLKQAVKHGDHGREAVTHYKVIDSYDNAMALVECRLETGRTHQIRVHMQAKGHPLIGDPLYGAQKTLQISRLSRLGEDTKCDKGNILNFPRQALHAHHIQFIHPSTEEEMSFTAAVPDDFRALCVSDFIMKN